jgi:hypothetical protein
MTRRVAPLKEISMTKTIDEMAAAPSAAIKSGFEKLQTAGASLAELNKANLEALTEAAKINLKSLEDAGSITSAYAKSATETAMTAMKALSTSKSIQEAVEVQTDYVRGALDSYFSEFNKVADVFLGAMKASSKPISERVTASMAVFQSAK